MRFCQCNWQSHGNEPTVSGTVITTNINLHYNGVIMGAMASQITSLTIVYSTVYSGADQRKHQSSTPLAFVRGIHRGPVNSPHKWPITRKMFPFDDVIMFKLWQTLLGVWLHSWLCFYQRVYVWFHFCFYQTGPAPYLSLNVDTSGISLDPIRIKGYFGFTIVYLTHKMTE